MRRPSVWFWAAFVLALLVWFGSEGLWALCGCVAFALVFALGCRLASLYLPLPFLRIPVPPDAAVLITGTSSGFGQGFALRLAERGFLVFAGVRKKEDGDRLVAASPSHGNKIIPLILDVTNAEHVAEAVKSIEAKLKEEGRFLFSVINNAGVTLIAPVETIDETTLRKGFEVNVFGTLAVTRAFLPMLRQCHEESAQRPRPKVVLLSSLVGLLSMPYMSAYCATKFAVEAFGDGLRRELAHQGIDVSIIEPGAFASNLTAPLAGCIDDFKQTENRYYKIPYGRSLWLFDIGSKKLPGIKPVVDLLEGILLSRFPPARALIGFDAFALGLISAVLPDSVVDLAVRVVLGGVSAAKEKRS